MKYTFRSRDEYIDFRSKMDKVYCVQDHNNYKSDEEPSVGLFDMLDESISFSEDVVRFGGPTIVHPTYTVKKVEL